FVVSPSSTARAGTATQARDRGKGRRNERWPRRGPIAAYPAAASARAAVGTGGAAVRAAAAVDARGGGAGGVASFRAIAARKRRSVGAAVRRSELEGAEIDFAVREARDDAHVRVLAPRRSIVRGARAVVVGHGRRPSVARSGGRCEV